MKISYNDSGMIDTIPYHWWTPYLDLEARAVPASLWFVCVGVREGGRMDGKVRNAVDTVHVWLETSLC
jgi:hypothetical protein